MEKPLVAYSATDSVLGFLYQFEMALLLLLDKPNSAVSIEYIDDISFTDNEQTTAVIQVKHHVKSKGNLQDASSDIWKTLNIWIDGMIRNELPEDISRILLTTEKAVRGTAAYYLRYDSNTRNICEALEILSETAKTSRNKENIKIYKKFIKLNKSKQEYLINSIFILDEMPDFESSRNKLIEKLRINSRPDTIGPFFTRVWETWVNMVTNLLRSDTKHSISYDELLSHIQDIRDQFTQNSLPIDFIEQEPKKAEIFSFNNSIFVKQLELVAATQPIIQLAIIDYWKAYQQRTRWINDELLFDNELIKYEKKLIRAWEKQFAKMQRNLGKSPTAQNKIDSGWTLYDWADNNTELCIRDRCTEPYVIQGSFHMLADELRVGWHLDFCDRLKSLLKTASGMIT
jgi:hypothetical protein